MAGEPQIEVILDESGKMSLAGSVELRVTYGQQSAFGPPLTTSRSPLTSAVAPATPARNLDL